MFKWTWIKSTCGTYLYAAHNPTIRADLNGMVYGGGSMDFGSQSISIQYFEAVDSDKVNKCFQGITPRGIYSGGYLTKVSDTSVSLSTLLCVIGDATNQVRVETSTAVTLTVSSVAPYVVLRWAYATSATNYMDVFAVAVGSIQTNDLIVGKCVYTGSTLSGFDYAVTAYSRSTPQTPVVMLKVEPTETPSMYVRIRAGRVNYGTANLEIADQLSPAFTAPVTNSRIDLIYINTSGAIAVSTGTAAVSPVAPDYNSKIVLAEVTITAGQTTITASSIKDVRNFSAVTLNTAVLVTGTQTVAGTKTFSSAPVLSDGANFSQKQAVSLVIENRTSDPTSPVVGQVWFRTDL